MSWSRWRSAGRRSAALATGGEPVERAFRRRADVPRKLVVLCNVSGSMEKYTRPLLLYLHAVVGSGRSVAVFAFGTRLTRLTPELRTRDPEKALGNRPGGRPGGRHADRCVFRGHERRLGRRALTRGAVVVVSDGWEREDQAVVSREMARLARPADSGVWVNPLEGNPDYQPVAGGMRAALPPVDRLRSSGPGQ